MADFERRQFQIGLEFVRCSEGSSEPKKDAQVIRVGGSAAPRVFELELLVAIVSQMESIILQFKMFALESYNHGFSCLLCIVDASQGEVLHCICEIANREYPYGMLFLFTCYQLSG